MHLDCFSIGSTPIRLLDYTLLEAFVCQIVDGGLYLCFLAYIFVNGAIMDSIAGLLTLLLDELLQILLVFRRHILKALGSLGAEI